MTLNILQPLTTKLTGTLDGKQILVYGSNSTGKTLQATKMPKPLFLPFEVGIRDVDGVNYFPITKWKDFRDVVKQLTDPKTIDQVKELYQTIVIDEVYTATRYIEKFLCNKHGVETIKEGNGGYGLWKELETEWFEQMDKLMKAGFTLYFIGHVDVDKHTEKLTVKGGNDKRMVEFVKDQCDIVAYVEAQGVDENNQVIPSKAYLAETDTIFARCRLTTMPSSLEVFSAKNLQQAYAEAIELKAQQQGSQIITAEEQLESFQTEELNFADLRTDIQDTLNELASLLGDKTESAFQKILHKNLGADVSLSEVTEEQNEALYLLLQDLKEAVIKAKEASNN